MSRTPATGHFDDAWLQVDKALDPTFFVRFLDASRRRALEFARSNPAAAFAHLEPEAGMSVLDCGCGTGDMLIVLSGLTAPGEAVGGDLSSAMLDEGRRRAEAAGAGGLRFQQMDVQALPFPDCSFDRVIATQLLVHVPDPRLGLHEICRVTARKGLVAIADTDWDTLVFGCSDKELGRRFTRLFSDGIRNGLVVRDYPGWLRAEGLVNIKVLPQQVVFDDWAFFREWIIEPSLPHFVSQGSMSAVEASALHDDLAHRAANDAFFAAFSFYTVTGRRP